MLVKGLGYLIAFGSLLFLVYITTKFVGAKTGRVMKGKYINVIESVSLGMDKQIHLIKVDEQFVLIASAGKSIEFLTTLNMDNYEQEEIIENNNIMDFKVLFEKYVSSFKNKKSDQADILENSQKPYIGSKENVFRSNLDRLKTVTSKSVKSVKEEKND